MVGATEREQRRAHDPDAAGGGGPGELVGGAAGLTFSQVGREYAGAAAGLFNTAMQLGTDSVWHVIAALAVMCALIVPAPQAGRRGLLTHRRASLRTIGSTANSTPNAAPGCRGAQVKE